ncbi:DUF4291 family protein [Candidatus Uabimicrobium amorphum]|uniref:DUF4291 domain-containing protein n=1 Tax=Uabimicrobium amorphum TaxID=2596890 RepID=A0A5S9IP12_UABAM|nr:DUF4291 family protein [Candidatus Uabimicrobium amorphum]BBM85047.1 hypothetical protein UABAM_03410 [Candidatus Uabimicrobium amorphum]
MDERKIIALYDNKCVYVYQAFGKEIAKEALQRQVFGDHFYLDRLSWIKPSFAWILYRSHYATKPGQERILRIGISHENFKSVLRVAIPTTQDNRLFSSGKEWRKKLQKSDVRYQWDPDRDFTLQKIPRRAIQIGLQKQMLRNYARKWILCIDDVTDLAKKIQKQPSDANLWPQEKEYAIDKDLQRCLGM